MSQQRPPVVGRPVMGVMGGVVGGGYAKKATKGSKATPWVLAGTGVLIIVALVMMARQMMGMVEDATFELPREQAVLQTYPEAALVGARFKAIWGEADRGTMIFEYGQVEGQEARDLIVKRATEAGWSVVDDKSGGEVRLRKKEAGVWGSHLVIRPKGDRVRILAMAGARDAWGKPVETDLYEDKFYKKNVAARWDQSNGQ